jgi:NADH dehydrogenase
MASRPHVVIIGAGFGGLSVARGLRHGDVRVTVVDRRNFHLFQPLLYQVATATLSPSAIAYPIRAVLNRQRNTRVFLAEVKAVEVGAKKVVFADGELAYDYLVVASGATHSYFGHPEWEIYAPALKTVEDALEMRRRILLAFEKAEREEDESRRAALLTFVVVGGGPTGVELAGAIAEIARHAMLRDFRNINPRDTRVLLVEAGPRILPAFPEELSTKAETSLRTLGVEVRTRAPVTSIREDRVIIGDRAVQTETVLWAAGVTASPLAATLGASLDQAGRVVVESDLSLRGHPEVFVIGDLAAYRDAGGVLLPGLAPVAIQEGKYVARCIINRGRGEGVEPFRYKDRGTLATIGRAAAVANFGNVRLSGLIAWIAWTFIHIFFLIGFRSKMVVLIEWAWAYVTMQRSARLITGEGERKG